VRLQSEADAASNTLKAQRKALERDAARLTARERAVEAAEEKLERRRAELDALSTKLNGRDAAVAVREQAAEKAQRCAGCNGSAGERG
jgi:uncharacterized protein (DUF3084 family)